MQARDHRDDHEYERRKKLIALAEMIAKGEDELICDLAETYGVMDMWALPIPLLATLASGLRENSRIKLKLSGNKIDINETLSAMAVDYLGMMAWIQSGARANNVPCPESVTDMLQGRPKRSERKSDGNGLQKFQTPDDFDRKWKELTGG